MFLSFQKNWSIYFHRVWRSTFSAVAGNCFLDVRGAELGELIGRSVGDEGRGRGGG